MSDNDKVGKEKKGGTKSNVTIISKPNELLKFTLSQMANFGPD